MDPGMYDDIKQPTEEQIDQMQIVHSAAGVFFKLLEQNLPEGPDKTFTIRSLRTTVMWAIVAITRLPDGTPRA